MSADLLAQLDPRVCQAGPDHRGRQDPLAKREHQERKDPRALLVEMASRVQ